LASILKGEPNWEALPQNTPPRIRELVADCLEKGFDDRLPDIGSARIQIKKALKEPVTASSIGLTTAPAPGWKRVMTVSLVALAAITTGISIWSLMRPVSPLLRPGSIAEFAIIPPPDMPLTNSPGRELAISPDGRHIVYRAVNEGTPQLYLRTLGNQEAQAIPGTEGAWTDQFFSPDGESIAFTIGNTLMRVGVTGGGPITLGDAPFYSGGSWGPEDTIVFIASFGPGLGLYRISASGGEPKPLVIQDPDARNPIMRNPIISEPQILPGGEAVLYGERDNKSWVVSMETGERKMVLEGTSAPRYAPTGHLVYETPRTGTLMAVPFDLEKLEVTGDPVSIFEGIRHHSWLTASLDYRFSENGTLIYIPRQATTEYELVWVDRQGTESLVTEEMRNYSGPRISPDGKQVAVTIFGENEQHVWIYDLEGDSFRRLTFEWRNGTPTWSPDGKWLAYMSIREDGAALYKQLADGSDSPQQMTENTAATQMLNSWSPDGQALAFNRGGNIWMLPMEEEAKPEVFISGAFPKFSPDGQWVAYIGREQGQLQVYVSPYSEPEVRWLVSGQEGGAEPVWSPDGSELFYRSGDRMMVVSVQKEPTFSAGRPRVLFEGSYFSSSISPGFQYYDVSPGGQRFLMTKQAGAEQAQINIVLNWFEELKRLVPTN
jgi:Tol biopolymer transport system component